MLHVLLQWTMYQAEVRYPPLLVNISLNRFLDDVLKARLKTIGVVEHIFTVSKGGEKGVDWKIIDVGGARNQRNAWAPFFSDAAALIFLAPMSAFEYVYFLGSSVSLLLNLFAVKFSQKITRSIG